MMNRTTKQFGVLSIMSIMLMSVVMFASAAECSSQDCASAMSVSVGNTAPTVPYVSSDTITLNGGATKTVYVSFNASDDNGYLNLDHSTAQVDIYKTGEAVRTSSVCNAIENSTLVSVFNCTVEMQFYDVDGAWNINASISDDSASKVENKTFEVTVNTLDYVSSDTTNVAWTALAAGSDDNEADGTITITNGGNQNYAAMTIKGYDANLITAESFSIDGLTGQSSDQTYMINNTAVDVTPNADLIGLTTHGAAVSEEIFFYVDIAFGIVDDTYTSNANWVISVAA